MASNPRLQNGAASPLGLYETSTTQHHRIGARGIFDDRVFHYASMSNSTGVVSNNLCQSAAPIANHVTETGTLTGFTVGSTKFTAVMGATAGVLNEYEDGYFKIESSTLGPGQIYKVKKHAAIGSGATVEFELYDPVVTTPTGTVTWSFIHNPWAHVIITPVTTLTNMICGAPLVTVPAAAATTAPVYFWMQTWGPCSVLGDTSDVSIGGALKGSAVVGSSALFGLDGNALTQVPQTIGLSLGTITTNTVYQDVYLMIAP